MERIERAYISIITNISYFKGLVVLVKSLRKTNTVIPLYVMIPFNCDDDLKKAVRGLGVNIIEASQVEVGIDLEKENVIKAWNQTFFKLNIMDLTQFKKLVYIDSDMIVLKNLDHLFERPALSATTGGKAAHPEWTEFNSGLMVIEPNHNDFTELIEAIPRAILRKKKQNKGFGDQDVFNEVYSAWPTSKGNDLGEYYNAEICFLEQLMLKFKIKSIKDLYVLHYIGYPKIWQNSFVENLRIVHGLLVDKKIHGARAWILYMKYLYL